MTEFHHVCKKGDAKLVEMIVQKSTTFNIDLNAKTNIGQTAFHLVCKHDHLSLVEMVIQKSAEFEIDLNAITNHGLTAFHYACFGTQKIMKLMIDKALFNLDLTKKDNFGRTGFQIAKNRGCHNGLYSFEPGS